MNDEFEYRFQILLREYDLLQQNIRGHDTIIFQIKGWAITVFSGFVALAANQKSAVYLAFSILVVTFFWTLDALFKSFQRHFILRNRVIERFLRSEGFREAIAQRSFAGFDVPDITAYTSVPEIQRRTSTWRVAFYRHTALPYLSMILLALVLIFWPRLWS